MHKKLTIAELKFLKNLYKVDWPKYVPTFALLDQFIERFEKYPEWQEKVIFLTVNEEALQGGTFLMIHCNHIVKLNSLETAPYTNLEKLLNDLDFSEDKAIWGMELHHASVVEKVVKLQNLEKTADEAGNCILFDFQPDSMALLVEKFAKPPQGFYYDSLNQSDIPQLADINHTAYSHSSHYFESVLKYNSTKGLYTDDRKLVACAVVREGGDTGMLHVDANYRRNKMATGILVNIFEELLKIGKLCFVNVSVDNEAAKRLFTYIGHMEIIGNYRRLTLRVRSKSCRGLTFTQNKRS